MPALYALYLHIPFCRHRCAYCDFNTYAGQAASMQEYVQALAREVAYLGEHAPERPRLGSIFFGGGTPSLLAPRQFEIVFEAIRKAYDLDEPEITLEANPGTVTLPALQDLYSIGFNRISFGVQSAHPSELRMLEREHDYFDVIRAVTWARQAGFSNLNLDLIYGLPHQTLKDWETSLRLVMGLNPEHFSLYALTLEHGTPFGRWAARGLMSTPDPDQAAGMYEWAGETLGFAGYQQYEISNWSRPDRQCRHNLVYWRGLPYLAAGAGAHGFANGYRYSNALRIKTYIKRMQPPLAQLPFPLTPATINRHHQTFRDETGEFMMTGLRLTLEGVSYRTFEDRFGRRLDELFGREIDELVRLGLLERTGDRLRLTQRGHLLGNQVFLRFVG